MQNKVRVHITGVKVNAPTYTNITFTPSLINFFYGKNGTGKSTLAKAFKDGSAALTWDGAPFSNDRILVYNEDFIAKHVQSYGNIPGVFTISEVNAEKKKLADEKMAKKKAKDDTVKANEEKIKKIEEAQDTDNEAYLSEIWKMTEDFRRDYPSALMYLRDRKKFVGKLEETASAAGDLKEIKKLYDTVYGTTPPTYQDYKLISPTDLPSSPLLAKPIISSSDTEFAKFIRALGNLGWVTKGHEEYHEKAGGKCPYCQQVLPTTFAVDLASCYDEQYRADKVGVEAFYNQYRDALNAVAATVEANQRNPWVTALSSDYAAKYGLFLEKGKANMAELQKKKTDPSFEIELEDLSDLLLGLNQIAQSINKEIKKHNDVVADIPNQQKQCSASLWAHIRSICDAKIVVHTDKKNERANQSATLMEENKGLVADTKRLETEAAKLNSQTVNTTKVMQDINRSIASAGFRGFELREKPGAKYVYELVREQNGKKVVADKNLSEGERHFIAFLYFYHMVMGSQSDEGKVEDKIVIIDDPVSSMDSSSLFVVAALTREMIAVCYNNYELDEGNRDDHIRQFFCMTHNPYFFREITYNRLPDYECVSFFEITKDGNNQSDIHECDDEDTLAGGGKINRSPVKNTYDALWDEYMRTPDPDTLMMVSRQILEYYFVQMIGYQNANLRRDLLDKHPEDFDGDDCVAASAMIAMINVGATGFNDGLYYDSSAADVKQLRAVFEKIFKVMKQEQHYNMMTRRIR